MISVTQYIYVSQPMYCWIWKINSNTFINIYVYVCVTILFDGCVQIYENLIQIDLAMQMFSKLGCKCNLLAREVPWLE